MAFRLLYEGKDESGSRVAQHNTFGREVLRLLRA
jgi:hypothetical protein